MNHPAPNDPNAGRHRYRPEIDGLRAVAVLLVVIYHAGLAFPGGFVGVDVFFVISGYLITSIIWGELIQQRFSMITFWERRCRRILPAASVVCLATLVMGWFQLMPWDYKALGQAAIAQNLFAANIHFWLNTGYFAEPAESLPLLHTWSLAVEEQFYFVAPLVLLGLSRIQGPQRTRVMFIVLGALFAGSLALSIVQVKSHPSAAFYLLHTRAWEMMMGSILALVPAMWDRLPRLMREIGAAAGLGMILCSSLLLSKQSAFPGLAAVPPCLGAALIIGMNRAGLTWTGRLLAWRPMVFVGLISYSLYLWHWPLFAYAHYWALEPLTVSHRLLLVAVGFILAVLSWRFVETPFRTRQLCADRPAIFRLSLVAVAGLLSVAGVIHWRDGFHSRTAHVARYADARFDSAFVNEMTLEQVQQGRFIPFGAASDQPAQALVWGDSHAMAALPAFDDVFKRLGWNGCAVTRSSTLPVLGYFQRTQWGLNEQAIPFNESVARYIEAGRIRDVVLIAYWPQTDLPDADGFRKSLVETVTRLTKAGSRVWILSRVPAQPFDVPKALVHAAWSGSAGDMNRHSAKAEDCKTLLEKDRELIEAIQRAGGRIIDPCPGFLQESGRYLIIKDDIPLYRDSHHLSTQGARLMLSPLLNTSFVPVVTGESR